MWRFQVFKISVSLRHSAALHEPLRWILEFEFIAVEFVLLSPLVALRETSTEANKKFFSDLRKFSNPSDNVANSTHPAFGFKRGLIQLIANMCFHNRMNQDCVCMLYCLFYFTMQ